MTTWTATLLEDPDNPDELILPLPEDMIAELEWKDGDTLGWKVEDGTIILTRIAPSEE